MDRTSTHEARPRNGSGTVLPTTEARQATTGTGLRYMLWVGIALVVIAFLIIYFLFARSWH